MERLVWEPLGTLFGSFWVVLGVLCGVSGALRSTKSGLEIRVGIVIHPTFHVVFRTTFHVVFRTAFFSDLELSNSRFNFENVDFTVGFPIFLKKSRVLTKDGFESVLGLSWARFGLFWGYFGSCSVLPH